MRLSDYSEEIWKHPASEQVVPCLAVIETEHFLFEWDDAGRRPSVFIEQVCIFFWTKHTQCEASHVMHQTAGERTSFVNAGSRGECLGNEATSEVVKPQVLYP